jgi:spermidine synthase
MMIKKRKPKKVLILGSGALQIGQAVIKYSELA